MQSANDLAELLFLIAANWRDYTEAIREDQARWRGRAAALGVSPEVHQVFHASMHPPGLPEHLSNRPGGRRRPRQKEFPKRRDWEW